MKKSWEKIVKKEFHLGVGIRHGKKKLLLDKFHEIKKLVKTN